jgi:hypothetical protein
MVSLTIFKEWEREEAEQQAREWAEALFNHPRRFKGAMPQGMAECPVCEGGGGWDDRFGRSYRCRYCQGFGLVQEAVRPDLARYGTDLRTLNDGETPF